MAEEIDTITFKKKYKMRSLGEDGLNTVVSIPRFVLQHEANKRGISLDDFLKDYRAVAQFDKIGELYYTFERVNEAEQC